DVSDVNEAPLTLTFSGGEVSEDALGGTVVASASVTDVDQGETFSYQLVDDAGGRFTIDADGNVLVSGDGVLDFETAKSHEITVRVTDSGGHTIERTLTIEITNVNEAVAEEAEAEVAEAQQAAGAARVAAYEMRQDTSDPQAEGGDTDRDDAVMDEPYAADANGDREVPTASETLNWIAAEVEELTELAKSVDTADIQFSDSTTSGGEAAFEDVFVQRNTEDDIEEPRGSTEETPEYERASDGFIGKFWTMLRAGFGTTNKVDESQAAGTHADRGHQSRSRRK
ncbi:MAG: cadherin repeat domain-containing protein, partial [Phycisphaerales bacterium JB061]